MHEIDVDAYFRANKGLIICFIITILVANCFLIFSTIRKGDFLYKPKSLIMISMAIGDIFLALFPMVVLARAFFEGYAFELSCTTSTVYLNFLIHFVYGFGLITMAVELVHRYKSQQKEGKTIRDVVKSLLYSAVPWFLGLVIILPITLADNKIPDDYMFTLSSESAILNMMSCFRMVSKSRILAMFGVSVILPAPLAVIVSFIVLCMKLLPAYYTAPASVTYQNPAQAVVVTSQNTNMVHAAPTPQYPAGNAVAAQHYPATNPQGTQQYHSYPQGNSPNPDAASTEKQDSNLGGPVFTSPAAQYPTQQYPPPNYPTQHLPDYPTQQYPPSAYPAQQYTLPQYLPKQYNIQQYTPAYFTGQQYIAQPNVVVATPAYMVQTQHPDGSALPDPGREKNALLVVSIVYFFCVVPLAIFYMGIIGSTMFLYDNVAGILHTSFFWLAIFRSLITPLIFILFNREK